LTDQPVAAVAPRSSVAKLMCVMAACALLAACSQASENSLDYEPKSRSTDTVKSEISELSSRIFDAMNIKSKATEPGPNVQPCDS
jgi:ABC-type uncharacterized transport system auxiliary subunit